MEAGTAGGVPSADAEKLRDEGYVVLKGVLSAELCDALRTHVLVTAREAAKQGRNDLFGNIQEAENRNDLKLDLCPPVVEALNCYGSRCGRVLGDVLAGGRTRIVELAAITSSRGAVAQPVHADTMHGVTRFLQSDVQLPARDAGASEDSDAEEQEEDVGSIIRAVATDTALIFTALVALQDIEPEMGPTHVWPATHTVEHHATLWSSSVNSKLTIGEADKAFGVPHLKMNLAKGDLVLYDSRTMHCGGPNASDNTRSVLCISCMSPGIRPDGTTWTMLSSLRNHLVLSDLPLPEKAAAAPANAPGREVALPPPSVARPQAAKEAGGAGGGARAKEDEAPRKAIPPLKDWDAAVQCTLCRRWRPCGADEAPRLTGVESGFQCPVLGFSCMQEQGYSTAEIDAIF